MKVGAVANIPLPVHAIQSSEPASSESAAEMSDRDKRITSVPHGAAHVHQVFNSTPTDGDWNCRSVCVHRGAGQCTCLAISPARLRSRKSGQPTQLTRDLGISTLALKDRKVVGFFHPFWWV